MLIARFSVPAPSAATTARSWRSAGHDVTFIARGAHLAAIRERGLQIRSAALGDFVVARPAEDDTAQVGPVDVVLFAVKAYDNPTALPLLTPLLGDETAVLTSRTASTARATSRPSPAKRERSAARPTSPPRSKRPA